mgnify:CR=1 FL=1
MYMKTPDALVDDHMGQGVSPALDAALRSIKPEDARFVTALVKGPIVQLHDVRRAAQQSRSANIPSGVAERLSQLKSTERLITYAPSPHNKDWNLVTVMPAP